MANEYKTLALQSEVLLSYPSVARVNAIQVEVLRTQTGTTSSTRRRQTMVGSF